MKPIAVFHGARTNLAAYEAALRAAGLDPVRNPPSLDGIEGVLLTGGTDVNPLLYGESPHPETGAPDEERDERETAAIHEAIRLDLPLFAICRGMQLLNVAQGGSLRQHIENGAHVKRGEADAHGIRIENGSAVCGVLDCIEYSVNSRHHQALARVGAGLRVTAVAPDGVVEAIERQGCRFVVGVQWHPEDRIETHRGDLRLFEAFAKAVAENRR